jgi:N6-L-threonylcarbamoyladenine synthase
VEWIQPVVDSALQDAGLALEQIDVIAATFRPGLVGSLLVGLSYAKGLALATGKPLVGVDHIQAHLYAPHLAEEISYPYVGLIVSGGHTLIAIVEDFDRFQVLGTTIDDACGEALDKVAKYYDLGYPGGLAIDRLSEKGHPEAFSFPRPNLHKGDHRYDVSYSGLKTAAIIQIDQFWNRDFQKTKENIAAAFQKAAVDIIAEKTLLAARDTGIKTIVAGGGVSANRYLRASLGQVKDLRVVFPPMKLCTDNGAMIAGIAYHHHQAGKISGLELNAAPRVPAFRKTYP